MHWCKFMVSELFRQNTRLEGWILNNFFLGGVELEGIWSARKLVKASGSIFPLWNLKRVEARKYFYLTARHEYGKRDVMWKAKFFVYGKKFILKIFYGLKRECKTLLVSTVIVLCYSTSFSHGKHDEKTERTGWRHQKYWRCHAGEGKMQQPLYKCTTDTVGVIFLSSSSQFQ